MDVLKNTYRIGVGRIWWAESWLSEMKVGVGFPMRAAVHTECVHVSTTPGSAFIFGGGAEMTTRLCVYDGGGESDNDAVARSGFSLPAP